MGKLIFVVIKIGLSLLLCKTVVSQTRAWISDKKDIWKEDRDTCGANGSFAGESIEHIKTILTDVTTTEPVWVYGYAVLSPWYGDAGCFRFKKNAKQTPNETINGITPAKCIKHCNRTNIGIQGTNCYCISNGNKDKTDIHSCNEDNISDSSVFQLYELFQKRYPSKNNGHSNINIIDQFNRSCLASEHSPGARHVIVSNCKKRHRYVCSNESASEITTSWAVAANKCLKESKTLSLDITAGGINNDILWTGFKRDEETVWGEGLPMDGGTYKCLAVVRNDTHMIFSFHECNESLQYLCADNYGTTYQKDATQSEQTTRVTITTIDDTKPTHLSDHTVLILGSCLAFVVAITLMIAGVCIARKRCRHLNVPAKVAQNASENQRLNNHHEMDNVPISRNSTPEYHYVCPSDLPNVAKDNLYDHSFVDHENGDYDVTTTQLKKQKQELRADDTYDHTPRSRVPVGGPKVITASPYDHV